jgi:PIN domain nuclease of toxin-antitoxin system
VNLLLDTCTLIWLASDPGQLSQSAAVAINDQTSILHISHASLWEITLKHGAGKLTLPESPRQWWLDQLSKWGYTELPLSAESLFRSSELTRHHSDPFDRVILAQAQINGCSLVSPDSAFQAYGLPIIW